MILWRIAPAAGPQDPRWQGRRIWEEVVVRAPSAAMARLIAGRFDANPDDPAMGSDDPDFRSGFEDEKLYWVARLGTADAARAGAGGTDGVVHAVLRGGPRLAGSTPRRPADAAPRRQAAA